MSLYISNLGAASVLRIHIFILCFMSLCNLVMPFQTITSPLFPSRQTIGLTNPFYGNVLCMESLSGEDQESNAQPFSPEKKTLNDLLRPSEDCRVNRMSGTDLAYIGDAVFELFVRSRHVWPSKRTSDLQNRVVALVRAEHQSHLLAKLKNEFSLTEDEIQVLMRGRNAVTRSKNRRNPAAYQDSTSFEALIGYLYITDQERCQTLFHWLDATVDELEE